MLAYIIGLLTGAALAVLIGNVKSGKMKIAWHQWLFGALAYVFFMFAVQNSIAFSRALEPDAAGFVWRLYGLLTIICIALVVAIPVIGKAVGKKG